ncbi:hypothetical protein [Gordonia alkanivorans]|uniref:hypothetical protein n=1 Tax=Gordonia alkanivorans TaxID=84096 RepID=UPI00244AB1CB|nr:hypothetical protein [Gordonia alkanivorans]MDH3047217.1 hypothetical protein [Gordonia alkanivorans]
MRISSVITVRRVVPVGAAANPCTSTGMLSASAMVLRVSASWVLKIGRKGVDPHVGVVSAGEGEVDFDGAAPLVGSWGGDEDCAAAACRGRNQFGDVRLRHVARLAAVVHFDPGRLEAATLADAAALPDALADAARGTASPHADSIADSIIANVRAMTGQLRDG